MKEPILEYLENAEPENKMEDTKKFENEMKSFVEQQGLKRKLILHGWKSKVKDTDKNKVQHRNSYPL